MAEPEQISFLTIGGDVHTATVRGKHYVQPRGYYYHPGTGPADQTCGSCRHCVRSSRWAKCGLNEARWTHSRTTDILTRSPACKYWELG
jgi:hypothetical protein